MAPSGVLRAPGTTSIGAESNPDARSARGGSEGATLHLYVSWSRHAVDEVRQTAAIQHGDQARDRRGNVLHGRDHGRLRSERHLAHVRAGSELDLPSSQGPFLAKVDGTAACLIAARSPGKTARLRHRMTRAGEG